MATTRPRVCCALEHASSYDAFFTLCDTYLANDRDRLRTMQAIKRYDDRGLAVKQPAGIISASYQANSDHASLERTAWLSSVKRRKDYLYTRRSSDTW